MKTNKTHLVFFLTILICFLCGDITAQEIAVKYVKPPSDVVNEFRYLGNAIVCISETSDGPGYSSCLRIGDFHIGDSPEKVEKYFGDPYKILDNARVYVLETNMEYVPYLVVSLNNNKIEALQLTGYQTTTPNMNFASINLGDDISKVIKTLGEPTNKEVVDEIDGVNWVYSPFPISIEIKKNKVYSIKIWKE